MDARDQDRFEDIGLVRLTTWATAAAVALTVATLASLSATGSQRAALAMAALVGGSNTQQPVQLASRPADMETDRRSLNEALRLLASDRDRLLTRVGSLERNLDDITGSIKSQMAARPATPETTSLRDSTPDFDALPAIAPNASAKPADTPDWLANVPEPWPSPSSAMEFARGPASFPPAPASAPAVRITALPMEAPLANSTMASRTEFGVDLGSGSNLEEVRILWNAARKEYGKLLGHLKPIVVRREDIAGNPDYRLVVGPLVNAGAAAKLCATLGSADVMCSTRPYQGERLGP